jgi:hypothetical protein
MSDDSEQAASTAEDVADGAAGDAAAEDLPTVDEVLERQRDEFPEQAATSTMQPGSVRDEHALADQPPEEHEG